MSLPIAHEFRLLHIITQATFYKASVSFSESLFLDQGDSHCPSQHSQYGAVNSHKEPRVCTLSGNNKSGAVLGWESVSTTIHLTPSLKLGLPYTLQPNPVGPQVGTLTSWCLAASRIQRILSIYCSFTDAFTAGRKGRDVIGPFDKGYPLSHWQRSSYSSAGTHCDHITWTSTQGQGAHYTTPSLPDSGNLQ